MKRLAVVMSVALVAWLALPAQGGEVYKGTIVSTDGGCSSNRYVTSDAGWDLTVLSKVSVQCGVDMYICTDVIPSGCGSVTGVKVLAETLFPTSIDKSTNSFIQTLSDGGGFYVGGGVLSVCPVTATAGVNCDVFVRSGRE